MPRDVNGNYTLPSGNPVVTNTLISSVWANTTLSDVATGLSNSLDRTGASSGMTGQFKAADGAIGAPGISFNSEPASGLYRAGAADFRFSVASADKVTFSANGLGATLVRAGDGAIGGPSFSWTTEPTTGWYRAGAGDIRFSLGGVDEIRLQSAVVTFTAGVLGSNFQPTGSALPAGNSIYLPSANAIGIGTNSAQRILISSVGGVTINAPSSGTTLSLTGLAIPFSVTDTNTAGTSSTSIIINRSGGTANQVAAGPSIQFNDTSGVGATALQFSNGQTELWQINSAGGWMQVMRVASSSTQGGKIVQIYDGTGAIQPAGFRNIPHQSKGGNYTPAQSDNGTLIDFTGSFNCTINGGVFNAGDCIVVTVGQGATVTLIQGAGMSMQFLGTTGTTGNRTLTGASWCTVYFPNTNVAFVGGPGVT